MALQGLELEARPCEQVSRDVEAQPAAQLQRGGLERREDERGQRIAARDLQEGIARGRVLVDDEHPERAGTRGGLELAADASREHHAPPFEAEVTVGLEIRVVCEHHDDLAAQVDSLVGVPAAGGVRDSVAAEYQRRIRHLRASDVAQGQRDVLAGRQRNHLAPDRERELRVGLTVEAYQRHRLRPESVDTARLEARCSEGFRQVIDGLAIARFTRAAAFELVRGEHTYVLADALGGDHGRRCGRGG